MALVESVDVPLGSKLPVFDLKDPNGKSFKSENLPGKKGLLVAITCNHCPYALAVWPRLIRLASFAKTLDINTVAINPNIHPDYPEDAPDKMLEKIFQWKISFPYLVDETQEIARVLDAQCTPDIYLYDATQSLVYHGRIDDNWKDESKVVKEELKAAIQNLAHGQPISKEQFAAIGCSIKWQT